MSWSKFFKESQTQLVVLALLLVLLALGAIPGYLKGNWEWQKPPAIATLKELKQIRQTGLNIPGWKTIEHEERKINGRKWLWQIVQKPDSDVQAILLLLPQNGPRDQPQVEWTEMGSLWGWDEAQSRPAKFTVVPSSGSTTVDARFFRATTKGQTFAVIQWYAWSSGGNPSPLPWFVADQYAQLRGKRAPWIAVNILMPMEPFGQVETMWNQAQSISQKLQLVLAKDLL